MPRGADRRTSAGQAVGQRGCSPAAAIRASAKCSTALRARIACSGRSASSGTVVRRYFADAESASWPRRSADTARALPHAERDCCLGRRAVDSGAQRTPGQPHAERGPGSGRPEAAPRPADRPRDASRAVLTGRRASSGRTRQPSRSHARRPVAWTHGPGRTWLEPGPAVSAAGLDSRASLPLIGADACGRLLDPRRYASIAAELGQAAQQVPPAVPPAADHVRGADRLAAPPTRAPGRPRDPAHERLASRSADDRITATAAAREAGGPGRTP